CGAAGSDFSSTESGGAEDHIESSTVRFSSGEYGRRPPNDHAPSLLASAVAYPLSFPFLSENPHKISRKSRFFLTRRDKYGTHEPEWINGSTRRKHPRQSGLHATHCSVGLEKAGLKRQSRFSAMVEPFGFGQPQT